MQAGQLTIASSNRPPLNASSLFAIVGMWITRLFGCWHTEMSRPFSHHGKAYRSCLNCGAQRQFNLRNWQMQGDFYYHVSKTSQLHVVNGFSAVRRAA